MAFKLVKRNKIAVNIKGTLPDEDGKPVPFDYKLHCERLGQDEIDAVRTSDSSIKAFIRRVAQGWENIQDESGQPISFAPENLDAVIDTAGMPMLFLRSYMEQVAATAKN